MKSLITVEWLYKNRNHPDLIILDASPIRNKSNLIAEFQNIKIKGARFFDMETCFLNKESSISNMFPSEKTFAEECGKLGIHNKSIIVVYDNLGIYTSSRVWWMFRAMGHENIAVLDGGLSAWKKENHDCEPKSNEIVRSSDFIANYKSNLVVNSTDILENISTKNMTVIDARSAGRFYGRTPEPRKNMESGHMPNALNLPFREVLEWGSMKSRKELVEIFEKFNLQGEKVAFTCGSGITACIILLALEQVSPNEKVAL